MDAGYISACTLSLYLNLYFQCVLSQNKPSSHPCSGLWFLSPLLVVCVCVCNYDLDFLCKQKPVCICNYDFSLWDFYVNNPCATPPSGIWFLSPLLSLKVSKWKCIVRAWWIEMKFHIFKYWTQLPIFQQQLLNSKKSEYNNYNNFLFDAKRLLVTWLFFGDL